MEQQQDRSGVGGSSGAGGGGVMQRQDQRVVGSNNSKPQENQQNHQPPPPAQPQKCPRCDSTNTKFCYYNNYSLSQPRYFCKTCRRYWTQGGTLRNVPVGGGCRKGKRLKRSTSPDNHHHILNTSSSTTSSNTVVPFVSPLRSKTILDHQPSSSPLMPIGSGMYYPGVGAGGGFLSSLAAFQTFNQPINGGGDQFGGSSLSLLPSFNLPFQQMHQLPQQNQQQQQQQHQHLYLHQPHDLNLGSSSDGLVEEKVSVQQPNRPSTSHQEWSQTFNSPAHSEATDGGGVGGYWNSSSTNNTNTTNSNTNTIGVSLNPTHWTDHLAGYGPPPPSQQQQQAPPPSTSSSSPPSFL